MSSPSWSNTHGKGSIYQFRSLFSSSSSSSPVSSSHLHSHFYSLSFSLPPTRLPSTATGERCSQLLLPSSLATMQQQRQHPRLCLLLQLLHPALKGALAKCSWKDHREEYHNPQVHNRERPGATTNIINKNLPGQSCTHQQHQHQQLM